MDHNALSLLRENAEEWDSESFPGIRRVSPEEIREDLYEIETSNGKIYLTFNLKNQKYIFKGMLTIYTMSITDSEHNAGGASSLSVSIDSRKDFLKSLAKIIKSHNSTPSAAERVIGTAMDYFITNLSQTLVADAREYLEEAFFVGLIKNRDENGCNRSESELFEQYYQLRKSSLKTKMQIEDGRGAKTKYAANELTEMLSVYDSILPTLKEATNQYKRFKNKTGWNSAIKALYPELPEKIIDQFALKGVAVSDLALSIAAEKFGKMPNEYLRQKIIKTRKKLRSSAG